MIYLISVNEQLLITAEINNLNWKKYRKKFSPLIEKKLMTCFFLIITARRIFCYYISVSRNANAFWTKWKKHLEILNNYPNIFEKLWKHYIIWFITLFPGVPVSLKINFPIKMWPDLSFYAKAYIAKDGKSFGKDFSCNRQKKGKFILFTGFTHGRVSLSTETLGQANGCRRYDSRHFNQN